jgi:hypothetical protein
MKTRSNNKRSRRNIKGGFFSTNNSVPLLQEECDPNKLSMIKGSQDLHANYQKCCPKGSFGTKNSSPYCKQVDLNFQASIKSENDANEYQGFEPEQVQQMQQQQPEPKKPWYKFWGGKKTRKHRKNSRRHRKSSRRNRIR